MTLLTEERMRTVYVCFSALLLGASGSGLAEQVNIQMNRVDEKGVGTSVGTVLAEDSQDGLVLKPELTGLPPGAHGFHVHENPSCDPGEKDGKKQAALAAGGHYDPQQSGKHAGPTGTGHLGDLPVLEVGQDGHAAASMIAPRLKVADLKGRALVIHAGGDNYADKPEPLGGGGKRIACGAIQ